MSGFGGTPVRDALDGAMTAIGAAGCETPRLDAEVLLAHVLGVDRARLLTDRELEVAGAHVRAYQDAVRRRAVEREPVAYIVGSKGFRHIELRVDRRALIPRPESELLVEVGVELVPNGARVLDLGTGSGAIALALKQERDDLDVTGADRSPRALELARANGERLGLEVRWSESDLLDGLADEFDAILANLPYVAEGDPLPPEVARHEPAAALFAGLDGLDAIRALLVQAAARRALKLLALEVGDGQAGRVVELAHKAGFEDVVSKQDLAGIERVVIAERA
jgi:release factor glutamine methyltransferase